MSLPLLDPWKSQQREYHEESCSMEEKEYFAKLAFELEQEEKKIAYMTAGRGRGPHQVRNYISRPPIVVKKEIPHCRTLPLTLASRGALSLPVVILPVARVYQDSAEGTDKDKVNTFKLMELI